MCGCRKNLLCVFFSSTKLSKKIWFVYISTFNTQKTDERFVYFMQKLHEILIKSQFFFRGGFVGFAVVVFVWLCRVVLCGFALVFLAGFGFITRRFFNKNRSIYQCQQGISNV